MQRNLGRSEMTVSALGMGCWAIGGPWDFLGGPAGWGPSDDATSIKALHAAYDLGVTLYDTAANYGTGHSERLVGQAFKDRRDKVVIATKFGYLVDEAAKQVHTYGDHQRGDVLSHLQADCEASLRRLDTDYIDLYQLHVNEYDPDLAAGVRDGLEALVAAGKIRYYGWSTDYPERARVFAEGPHCVAIQHHTNVVDDAAEMFALCEELNLASINRGPLAMGMLTGKYDANASFVSNDVRTASWFQDGMKGRVNQHLPAIRDILTSGGRTLAQGALAWLWARSPMTLPIPGIRTVAQAEENAAAMQHGQLTPEQMQEIERLLGRA